MSIFNVEDIIKRFNLKPLPHEGGYYKQTWKTDAGTAIYYLITPETWSSFHILDIHEVWHFYAGDVLKQIQLFPEGNVEVFYLGSNFKKGYNPQLVCEAGIWQATKLESGGKWAFVGTTTSPPYTEKSIRFPDDKELEKKYPAYKELLREFF